MKHTISVFLLIFVFGKTATPQSGLGNITAISVDQNKLTLHAGAEIVVFKVCLPNVIKANYLPQGIEDPDTLVIGTIDWPLVSASFDTSGDPIIVQTSEVAVEIARAPMRFHVRSADGGELLRERTDEGFFAQGIKLEVTGRHFYGIHNAQSGGLPRNGGGRIEAGRQGQAGAPFIWTPDGYGLLMDSDGGEISINNGMMDFLKGAGGKRDIELYIITGAPRDIFAGMTAVSGRAPLFPKFAYGFLNTEWGMDQNELLADVQTYRDRRIPVDAYILDFDWMDWGSDNYGEFRWGPKFPAGPSGALKTTLDSLGLKLFGVRKPRVHTNTVQGQEVQSKALFFDTVTDYFSGRQVWRLDFHKPETRKWFWETFINKGDAYNKGVIGYWNDEADEYGGNMMFMQMQRANYEGQRSFSNRRVWSINRNFYLGAQRYAYAHWSGDISTGFSSMAAQRLFMLSSITLGSSWWAMDIGGFGGTPTPENYIRWMQFGAFAPVYRVHGTFNEEREPWNYGPDAERIARRYIELRYKLLPYIYSYAWENNRTGAPLVRPLIFAYPDDPNVANRHAEWLFGDHLLVHPVVTPGAQTASVYLPKSDWIDYHRGDFYSGPGAITLPVTLDDIPIFVRAGAVLPTAPAVQFTDDPASPQDVVFLQCYPGGAGEFVLYEDDGATYGYENGAYAETRLRFADAGETVDLQIDGRTGAFIPAERDFQAVFHLLAEKPLEVRIDGAAARETSADSLANGLRDVWAYDAARQACLVRIADDGLAATISVTRGVDTIAPDVDTVYCVRPDSVIIRFTERVLKDSSENSAANAENYRISNGMNVLAVKIFSDGKSAALLTTPHAVDVMYQIDIFNIADQSPQRNLMAQVTKSYSCASSQTIVLQQGRDGYSGVSDTHIAEYFPDRNMGGNPRFEAGRFDGANFTDDKSMLIRFDLSTAEISDSGSVMQAKLILTFAETRNGAASKQLAAHRLLREWNPGIANAGIDGRTAQAGEATWASAKHETIPWNSPGGDFAQLSADVAAIADNPGAVYSWDVTSMVKHWVAFPDSNFGLILREPAINRQNGSKVFYASEYEQSALRPRLEVVRTFTTHVPDDGRDRPATFLLHQNYPNPFNSGTAISFQLPAVSEVELKIYNPIGQLVRTLVKGQLARGSHTVLWDGKDNRGVEAASGVFVVLLEAGQFVKSMKMLKVK